MNLTVGEQLEELISYSKAPLQRIPLGLLDIDEVIQGIAPGEVCMIMGRSNAGKSVVGQNIIVNNLDKHSIFFSMEMPMLLALQRMLSMVTLMPQDHIQELTEMGKLEQFRELVPQFENHMLVDKASVTDREMSEYLKFFEERHGVRPDFILADYWELMGGSLLSADDYAGFEAQCVKLKNFAKEESMRVFVLHQTNRIENSWLPPTENSPRKAGFTQADQVIGMWQPSRDPALSYAERIAKQDLICFNVLKNRPFSKFAYDPLVFRLKPSLKLVSQKEDDMKAIDILQSSGLVDPY